MPTRRQRRRREKTFRHEYGFVELDEEGNEVELEGAELRARRGEPAKAKPSSGSSGGKRSSRASRDPDPPTWQRSLRRGMLWSPATVVLSVLVFRSAPIAVRVGIGLAYALAFVPMTYWIDGVVYRRFEKRRQGQATSAKKR
jgi:hypothetical protein